MISTHDLSRLPDIPTLRRLMRALAMLDAILSPEWEFRYYSFNAHWAEGEMMASMRNGSGDEWFALFCPGGAVLKGLAHEAPLFQPNSPNHGIFGGLPSEFRANFLHEPAFDTANASFCIWRLAAASSWSCGPVAPPPGDDADGSVDLLSILDGDPEHYCRFAADYFERGVARADVAAIYAQAPLSEALVRRINPAATLASLTEDIQEIGYPEAMRA